MKNEEQIKRLYEHLPSHYGEYLWEATDTIIVDPSYALTAFFAIASTCIGASVKVELSNTWTERCGIFSALVGLPSAKKSPILSAVVETVLDEIDLRYDVDYEAEKEAYKQQKKDKVEGIVPPIAKTVFTTNMTLEACAKLLKDNLIGILVFKDELSHVFANTNAFNNGKGDLQEILEWYNNKSISVARKTSESIRVRKPALSIVGGIQPKPFVEIFSAERIGLKERFIYSFSNIPIHVREISDREVSDQVKANYINGLLSLRMTSEEIVDKGECRTYKLSKEARKYWKKWVTTLPVTAETIDSMYDKMIARAVRFSAILHTLKHPLDQNNIISLETMEKAIDFSNFYIQNHLQAIRLFEEGDVQDKIHAAHSWLRKCYREKKFLTDVDGREGPKFSTFYNNGAAGVTNQNEARKVLGMLEDRGYGYFWKSRSKQYPKEIFVLHHQLR